MFTIGGGTAQVLRVHFKNAGLETRRPGMAISNWKSPGAQPNLETSAIGL
jgi:hypothetical protein